MKMNVLFLLGKKKQEEIILYKRNPPSLSLLNENLKSSRPLNVNDRTFFPECRISERHAKNICSSLVGFAFAMVIVQMIPKIETIKFS